MKHDPVRRRRPVNLSLDADTVAEARALGLNLSQTCDAALTAAVKAERTRKWQEENAAWIAAHHRWVDENPLPLERYRLF